MIISALASSVAMFESTWAALNINEGLYSMRKNVSYLRHFNMDKL